MARKLENWLKSYLEYAQHTEAPPAFHFWSGIGTVAGALRRQVWFDQYFWKWYPNFYIILVAPSGVATKTTAMNMATELLRALPDIRFGPDSVTWQSLIDAFEESATGVPGSKEDPLDLNTTFETTSCLTFASGELGNFLDPDDTKFISLLIELWDGREHPFERRTRGDSSHSIYKPWINLIACTTPEWIAESMNHLFITGGMFSRCLPVHQEGKSQLVAYVKREIQKHQIPLEHLARLKNDLIDDLADIAKMKGEFTLTEEAYVFGEAWYKKINTTVNFDLQSTGFGGYLSRKQGHAHKIAMVLSAAQRSTRVITEDDLKSAIDLLESLEADMSKVVGEVGTTPDLVKARHLISIVHGAKKLTRGALYRKMFQTHGTKTQEFSEMLTAAIEAGFVRMTTEGSAILVTALAPPGAPPEAEDSAIELDA